MTPADACDCVYGCMLCWSEVCVVLAYAVHRARAQDLCHMCVDVWGCTTAYPKLVLDSSMCCANSHGVVLECCGICVEYGCEWLWTLLQSTKQHIVLLFTALRSCLYTESASRMVMNPQPGCVWLLLFCDRVLHCCMHCCILCLTVV